MTTTSTTFHLRYSGTFINQRGHTWRAEIWQQSPLPFTTIGDLTFDADTPIEIEWSEIEKYETTQGATCTLNVISPTDRTYIDLYQVEPGNIMLYLYLDDQPFWSGTLDCETYEEPYQYHSSYTVTLTFTDFGSLDRIKFAAQGIHTLRWYINHILTQAHLDTTTLLYHTTLRAQTDTGTWCQPTDTPDAIYINAANFYDEDGTPSTLADTLTALLQPLALRIQQREGHIHIYDLNALTLQAPTTPIQWEGDQQTLSVDPLYRQLTIKFSPYGDTDIITPTTANLNVSKWSTPVEIGWEKKFLFSHTTQATSDYDINPHIRAQYFKMQQVTGGSDDTGIAYLAITSKAHKCRTKVSWINNGNLPSALPQVAPRQPITEAEGVITEGFETMQNFNTQPEGKGTNYLYRTPLKWCPVKPDPQFPFGSYPGNRGTVDRNLYNYYILLKQELLLDARISPFEAVNDVSDSNEYTNHIYVACRQAAIYIPFSLVLFDDTGTPIYQYITPVYPRKQYGEWRKVDYTDADYWYHNPTFLVYHNDTDKWAYRDQPATDGWTANRDSDRFILYTGDDGTASPYPSDYEKEGEFIPLPPVSGYLQLTIYQGAVVMDNVVGGKETTDYKAPHPTMLEQNYPLDFFNHDEYAVSVSDTRFQQSFRWWLYKFPTLEIVQGINARDSKPDDTQITAWVNEQAANDLSLDLICGTLTTDTPTSRGVLRTAQGKPIPLRRTNTAPPYNIEYDLIGTIFSQYATRHTTLEGEALTPTTTFQLYTDRAMSQDTHFLIKSEILNAISGTSTIKYVQLTPEEWDKNIIRTISTE